MGSAVAVTKLIVLKMNTGVTGSAVTDVLQVNVQSIQSNIKFSET